MDNVAIKVEKVSKDFRLAHAKATTVKGVFTNILKGKSNRTTEAQHALRDVSFEVKQGEFFGIVGRNGSGKSTLLKILAGIYQPNRGTVTTQGKLVPFIELGVGFNPELTGRENVFLNGALLGFSREEVEEMYEDIVTFAELDRFMDQKLKNYSSGMQVRLAFSMAVRAKADILLIDEVLAVGDADFQRKCFNYFSELKKNKTTVVFVSHDMSAVREYCDRAMLIEKNEVIAIGSTNNIAEKYLQLFMLDDNANNMGGSQQRWGDQKIYVSSVRVENDDKFLTITETIVSKIDVEGAIAGIKISSASGIEVTGTNTKIEKHSLPPLRKDEKIEIIWKLPNVFSDGKYSVDPAILHNDEITVADWWNEAVYFTVKKDRHLPYLIDPGFDVRVNSK